MIWLERRSAPIEQARKVLRLCGIETQQHAPLQPKHDASAEKFL
jgi:hypothetical protein